MAFRGNSLPGDHVQEQTSSENDCPESVEQLCSLHNFCEETGSPAPCTSEADSANAGYAVRLDVVINSDVG